MYSGSRSRGLGIAPVIIAAAIPFAVGLVRGPPAYDGIAVLFDRAISGDPAAVAELDRLAHVVYQTRSVFGMGTNFYAYAKNKWAEYQARVSSGSAAPLWYGPEAGLMQESPILGPIAATIQRAVSNPLVLVGLAVGAYVVFFRRRRS